MLLLGACNECPTVEKGESKNSANEKRVSWQRGGRVGRFGDGAAGLCEESRSGARGATLHGAQPDERRSGNAEGGPQDRLSQCGDLCGRVQDECQGSARGDCGRGPGGAERAFWIQRF